MEAIEAQRDNKPPPNMLTAVAESLTTSKRAYGDPAMVFELGLARRALGAVAAKLTPRL